MHWEKAVLELIPSKEAEDDPDLLTLVVGEADKAQSFILHKTWLQLSSVGFKNLLSQNQNSYKLVGLRPYIFEEIVKHIYTFSEWKFNGNLVDACSLLKAALDFELEELTLSIHKTISKLFLEEMGLESRTACFVFDVVRNASFVDEGNLKNDILTYICKNAKLILTVESFLNLSLDGLLEIIRSDNLEVDSELDVFKAVVSWGINTLERNCTSLSPTNLQDTLREPLKCVRFSNLRMFEFEYYIQRMDFVSSKQELFSAEVSNDEVIDQEKVNYLFGTAEKSSESPGDSIAAAIEKPRKYLHSVRECENVLELELEPTVVDILRAELYLSNLKFKLESSRWSSMLSDLKDETRRAYLTLYESSQIEIEKMSLEIAVLRKEMEISARQRDKVEAAASVKTAVLNCEWWSFLRHSMDFRLGPNDAVLVVLQNATNLTLQQVFVGGQNYSQTPQKIGVGKQAYFSIGKRPPLPSITLLSVCSSSYSVIVGLRNISEDEFAVRVYSDPKPLSIVGKSTWKSDFDKYFSRFWIDQVTSRKTNSAGLVATKKFLNVLHPVTIRASMTGGILKILIFQDLQ